MIKPFALDRRTRRFMLLCAAVVLASAIALALDRNVVGAFEAGSSGALLIAATFRRAERPVMTWAAIWNRPWLLAATAAATIVVSAAGYAICARLHCGC